MSCAQTIADYGLRALGLGERLLPRSDFDLCQQFVLIGSGLALSFDDLSLAGLVLPRSGLGHRGLVLGNAVGLIDPDYTGEVMISAWNRNHADSQPITIRPGERIAQLLFVPVLRPEWQFVDDIAVQTERAAGGFGSTGR